MDTGSSVTVSAGSLTMTAPTINLDNALAEATLNSVLVSGGSLNLTNGARIKAGDGLVVLAGNIQLDSLSYLKAANHALVKASGSFDLTNYSYLEATGGDAIVEVGSNLTLENGSYIKAGNDIELVLKGSGSVLTINSAPGIASYIWAMSPNTIYLDFPLLAGGGVVIDGDETIKTVAGGSGFFVGPGMTPAADKAGLNLTYGAGKGGGDGSIVTNDLLRAVLNAVPEETPPDPNAKKEDEDEKNKKKGEDDKFGEKEEKDNRPSKRLAACT